MHVQAANPRTFLALATSLAGVAAAVLSSLLLVQPFRPGFFVLIFLAGAAFEASPVGINKDVTATMSVVVVFVAIAMGGVPAAAVAGTAVGLASAFAIERDRAIKTVFNVGMHTTASALAALAFFAIARTPLLSPASDAALVEPVRLTGALLLAGLIYTVANAVLISLAVHLISSAPWGATTVEILREVIVVQFLSVGLAAIAYTLLVETGAISLVLVSVPLVLARRSLRSVEERQNAYDRMVRAFVKAIELKDGYTRGHAERVSDLSVLVAERMGLSYEERQLIRYGAILHDVGKIGVSLGILCKAGPLDDDEFGEMKLHPEIGAEMLADIDFLKPALTIVHHHHERLDGRGYPKGLAGDEIPLLTRVVTAVDAFDAMTSTRSYRRALPIEIAIEELEANAGTQFDPVVVKHLIAVIAEHGWQVTDEAVQGVALEAVPVHPRGAS